MNNLGQGNKQKQRHSIFPSLGWVIAGEQEGLDQKMVRFSAKRLVANAPSIFSPHQHRNHGCETD